MNTTQELGLVAYIKERVKFDGDKCQLKCGYYYYSICHLFHRELSFYYNRCEQCKRFFD